MSHILLKEELSSCDGDRPVCRVDQVIDTLAVLRSQNLICTTVETNTKHQSISSTIGASSTCLFDVILKFAKGLALDVHSVPTDMW